MRVGVDASCWANGRGYGRYTRELLTALLALDPEDEFVFFVDPLAEGRLTLEAPNLRRVRVRQSAAPTEAASAEGSRSPVDMLRLTRAVWRERLDVFFSPSVYTYFPLPPGRRALVCIHDAIADRFPELTLPTPRARLFWRAKMRLAILQARLILTVSDFARREIQEVLGVPERRIRVAVEAPSGAYRPSPPPEVAAAAARHALPPGARWLVYVGGFAPHKHVDLIVRAHAAVARECGGGAAAPHLLLVGVTSGDVFHGDLPRIRRTIAETGVEHLVHWTGFVPDDELRHLHSGALALLLPSASEGFGLPAVEAAACGTPVVATTSSPLPQLLEGGGWFVPPGDLAALTSALRQVLADEPQRRARGARARQRAGELSWERCAREALAALKEAAA
jgi:glycosyltransferase involved in cell wall biosynthesis